MKYIDIHSHLYSPEFDTDRVEILKRLEESMTGTIVIGVDYETSEESMQLAENNEHIWACIGIHPVDDPKKKFEKEKFKELAKHPKVVAIGECGLDFFKIEKTDAEVERQTQLFQAQIDLSVECNKPLMIHQRDAIPDVLDILERQKEIHGELLWGNIHFFSGSLEQAKRFWGLGFTTSFTGVITFTHDYDEVIKNAPLSMLMSETDAPWVAPVPYRGKRNEPSYVSEVVKKIAEIRGEGLAVVEKALISNAERVFKISA